MTMKRLAAFLLLALLAAPAFAKEGSGFMDSESNPFRNGPNCWPNGNLMPDDPATPEDEPNACLLARYGRPSADLSDAAPGWINELRGNNGELLEGMCRMGEFGDGWTCVATELEIVDAMWTFSRPSPKRFAGSTGEPWPGCRPLAPDGAYERSHPPDHPCQMPDRTNESCRFLFGLRLEPGAQSTNPIPISDRELVPGLLSMYSPRHNFFRCPTWFFNVPPTGPPPPPPVPPVVEPPPPPVTPPAGECASAMAKVRELEIALDGKRQAMEEQQRLLIQVGADNALLRKRLRARPAAEDVVAIDGTLRGCVEEGAAAPRLALARARHARCFDEMAKLLRGARAIVKSAEPIIPPPSGPVEPSTGRLEMVVQP